MITLHALLQSAPLELAHLIYDLDWLADDGVDVRDYVVLFAPAHLAAWQWQGAATGTLGYRALVAGDHITAIVMPNSHEIVPIATYAPLLPITHYQTVNPVADLFFALYGGQGDGASEYIATTAASRALLARWEGSGWRGDYVTIMSRQLATDIAPYPPNPHYGNDHIVFIKDYEE